MTKIRRCFLIISLAASCCRTTCGQKARGSSQGNLAGDVADKAENALIAKAILFVHGANGQKDVIVKVTDGRFQLSLAPGLYDVFVAAAGFAPSCRVIEISEGRMTTYKPRLGPDEEHLQPGSPASVR